MIIAFIISNLRQIRVVSCIQCALVYMNAAAVSFGDRSY